MARLNEIQPHGIFGYASAIATAAGEAVAGRLAVTPVLVGASSEPLLEPMARLIQDGFGVEPSDTFAATEIGALVARTFPGAEGINNTAAGLEVQVWAPNRRLDAGALRSLAATLGDASVIPVERAEDLPQTPAGKRRRFIGF